VSLIRIKLDDKTHEIDPDRLKLGEVLTLRRDFGFRNMAEFDAADPEILIGLLVIAMQRDNPDTPYAQIVAEVKDLDFMDVAEGLSAPEPVDPSRAGAKDTSPPAKRGKSAKTPGKRGAQG
jgi:hypothetical protein